MARSFSSAYRSALGEESIDVTEKIQNAQETLKINKNAQPWIFVKKKKNELNFHGVSDVM